MEGDERMQRSLRDLAAKVEKAKGHRAGDIVLRLSGAGGGTFRLSSGRGRTEFTETTDVATQPLVEVMGDAETVHAVLDGEVDARQQFLEGGIRVRGDLRYVSDLAQELGLLDQPL